MSSGADGRASGRPRGSSGRRAGTPSRTSRSSARGSVAAARTAVAATTVGGEGDRDAPQVPPRLRRAVRRGPIPEVAGRARPGGPAGPSGRWQTSHEAAIRSRARTAAAEAAHPARRRRSSAARRPGRGPVDRPASTVRPSLEVVGLRRGRRPDRLEAVPLLRAPRRCVRSSASAIAWVARWSSAGSVEATSMGSAQRHVERVVGRRRIVTGRIREPVLAASVAGPAGSVVQAPNRRTGMPSAR